MKIYRSKLNLFIFALMSVLITSTSMIAAAHKSADNADTNNIVETAAAAGNFETLIAAAKAADLVPVLVGDGPLTVFAPTDEAFGALPAGTIQTLLKPENQDMLARILSYHVIAGEVGSNALADEVTLKTVAGPTVEFVESEQGFTVEGARILATDIDASNGIIHVIDRVIMPPEQMTRADAQQMIVAAISRGVPMFNHGNARGTVQVYTMAVQSLLDNVNLTEKEQNTLTEALNKQPVGNEYQGLAWSLRYALDEVMASLQARSNMTS